MNTTTDAAGRTRTLRTPDCGHGTAFYLDGPALCGDCNAEQSRHEHGWTPENSLS